jgi:hypothetical protein
MNPMETSLSEKQSLELISQMIQSAKNRLQKGMGKTFLLWGYLVAVISLLIFILLILLPGESRYYAYMLWALMAVGAPFHIRLAKKMEQQQLVKTYIDRIMDYVWIAFTISLLTVISGMLLHTLMLSLKPLVVEPGHEFRLWFYWLFVTPVMLCLYGLALFISGKAYEFKPLVVGGYICWGGAFFLIIAFHHPHLLRLQQIVLCISAVAGFIIPGHLLNKKEQSDV